MSMNSIVVLSILNTRFDICEVRKLYPKYAMIPTKRPPTVVQSAAGDYSQGTAALTTVTEEIAKYVPYVVKLCYAIAGVVAVVGAISVYIKMNNEEQDVKKSIMMIVGACIFLVAAAQTMPLRSSRLILISSASLLRYS